MNDRCATDVGNRVMYRWWEQQQTKHFSGPVGVERCGNWEFSASLLTGKITELAKGEMGGG